MNVRERHAGMLLSAADNISVIKRTSPLPEKCLKPALEKAEKVWKESASYIDPRSKRPLRIAIVTMRGLLKVAANDEAFIKDDIFALRRSEKAMREVSNSIIQDRRSKKAQMSPQRYSATGQRLTDPREIAGSTRFEVLSSSLHADRFGSIGSVGRDPGLPNFQEENEVKAAEHLQEANTFRSKLPVRLPDTTSENGYVPAPNMPLLIIPKKFIKESDLQRADIKDYHILKGGHLPRQGDLRVVNDTGMLLLNDQYLAGIRGDVVNMPEDEAQELIDSIIKLVSRRKGPHINPRAVQKGQDIKSQLIISPGNRLAWIWLVPAAQAAVLSVKSVSFPWASNKSTEAMTKDIRAAKKELEELQELEKIAVKSGNGLSRVKIDRMSVLRQLLDEHPLQEDFNALREERDALKAKMVDLAEKDEDLSSKDLARLEYLNQYLRSASPVKKVETQQEINQRREDQKVLLEKRVAARFKEQLAEIQSLKEELESMQGVTPKKATPEELKAIRELKAEIDKMRLAGKAIEQKISSTEGFDYPTKLIMLKRQMEANERKRKRKVTLAETPAETVQETKKQKTAKEILADTRETRNALEKKILETENSLKKAISDARKKELHTRLKDFTKELEYMGEVLRIKTVEAQLEELKELKEGAATRATSMKALQDKLSAMEASFKPDKTKSTKVFNPRRKEILDKINLLQRTIDVGRENIRKAILQGRFKFE